MRPGLALENVSPKFHDLLTRIPDLDLKIAATLGAFNMLAQMREDVTTPFTPERSELMSSIETALASSFLFFLENNLSAEFFRLNRIQPQDPIVKFSSLFEALVQGLNRLQQGSGSMPINSNKLMEQFRTDVAEAGLMQFLENNSANGVSIVEILQQLQPDIDESMRRFAPYNQQAYAYFQLLAHNEGNPRLDLPPFPEREQFSTVFIATVARSRAGKNTVAKLLQQEYGFQAHSLSTLLRWMVASLGATPPFSREILIEEGKRLKSVLGSGILIDSSERTFSEAGRDQLFLFDGLRTEAEWQAIQGLAQKRNGTALLVSIETDDYSSLDQEQALLRDQRIRFDRSLLAGEDKDPKSEADWLTWKATDDKERVSIDQTAAHATHHIINREGHEDDAQAQIRMIVGTVGLQPGPAPSHR